MQLLSFVREEQGKFPDYPSDEEGGSALIFNPDLVIHDSDGEVIKTGDKGKKEEKKEGEEEEEKGFRLGPSDFLNSLKDGDKTFSGTTILVVVILTSSMTLSFSSWSCLLKPLQDNSGCKKLETQNTLFFQLSNVKWLAFR